MGNFFPRWTNFLPLQILICLGVTAVGVLAAVWYTATPKYTRVGYMPEQPIPFEHSIHVGQLGMDCRYCHSFVEASNHSNIPAAQVCWNCHGTGKVKWDSPKLEPLRAAMDTAYEGYTGKPIEWVQIHETPDYAYFNHAVHVNRGVSCKSCHGEVNDMQVVYHAEPHSMAWCLDCHRDPQNHLRPMSEITNLDWKPEDTNRDEFYAYLASKTGRTVEELNEGEETGELTQEEIGQHLKEAWNVHPPEHCATCHR